MTSPSCCSKYVPGSMAWCVPLYDMLGLLLRQIALACSSMLCGTLIDRASLSAAAAFGLSSWYVSSGYGSVP